MTYFKLHPHAQTQMHTTLLKSISVVKILYKLVFLGVSIMPSEAEKLLGQIIIYELIVLF